MSPSIWRHLKRDGWEPVLYRSRTVQEHRPEEHPARTRCLLQLEWSMALAWTALAQGTLLGSLGRYYQGLKPVVTILFRIDFPFIETEQDLRLPLMTLNLCDGHGVGTNSSRAPDVPREQ